MASATTPDVVEKMLEMANVKKTDVVYDLGSGDGRIVVTAAKKFGTRGVGIDIDPQRIKEAKENAKRNGVEDLVEFRLGDLFAMRLRPNPTRTISAEAFARVSTSAQARWPELTVDF